MILWRIVLFFPLYVLICHIPVHAQSMAGSPGEMDGYSGGNASRYRDSDYVIIRHILITGNRRTKDAIILRDFDLKPGDTLYYTNAMQVLEDKRQQLINTSLFLTVNVYFRGWTGKSTDVAVDVLERWYTFGYPIFSLADRNFNVWWVQEKHSLGRVNYGLNFFQNNVTGKNDQVVLSLQGGYTDNFALTYNLPYFDKNLQNGLGFTIAYNTAKQMGYVTDSNKLQFFGEDGVVNDQFTAGITYTYRKAIRFKHQLSLNYYYDHVADTILKLNPAFFPNRSPTQRYFELAYRFSYIGADDWAYPLNGFNINALLSHKGFGFFNGVNVTELYFQTAKYWNLFPNTYLAIGLRGRIQLPVNQPYFLQTGMGYQEDYLRGLEYYVVDGSTFGIFKTDLKWQVFSWHMHFPFLPSSFESIPIRVFMKIFSDIGYAPTDNSGNSFLNNHLLYSEGFGLDIVTYYDVRLRLEYSFNQLGQNGLFLHSRSEF